MSCTVCLCLHVTITWIIEYIYHMQVILHYFTVLLIYWKLNSSFCSSIMNMANNYKIKSGFNTKTVWNGDGYSVDALHKHELVIKSRVNYLTLGFESHHELFLNRLKATWEHITHLNGFRATMGPYNKWLQIKKETFTLK